MSIAEKYLQLLDRKFYKSYGKVSKVVGLTIESIGPKARLNDLCKIYLDGEMEAYVMAEVVGFHESRLILMPFDNVEGVGVGCVVCLEPFWITTSHSSSSRRPSPGS